MIFVILFIPESVLSLLPLEAGIQQMHNKYWRNEQVWEGERAFQAEAQAGGGPGPRLQASSVSSFRLLAQCVHLWPGKLSVPGNMGWSSPGEDIPRGAHNFVHWILLSASWNRLWEDSRTPGTPNWVGAPFMTSQSQLRPGSTTVLNQ